MSDNIKVVVKVRPLISREIEEKHSYQWRVKNNTLYQLDQNGKDNGQSFTFDKVYDKDTKTSDVYNDIAKPIVEAATAGFNGTIFAYGQTSSGKTYTMTGTDSSPGIIPLAVLNLFEIIKNVPGRDFLVRVSYIEIYNETVKDLLNVEKKDIKVHETLQGIKVDATEKVTSSPEEVLEAMKDGEANRQKGATNMNEQSSRSHSIFQITIESREHIEGDNEGGCVNVSQLNLVDLAGSERAGQTGATGIRFKEGTHINKSLSALALVIKQLSEDPNKYANYRDSKLTRILQNSLGGNAKTSIICAVTPAAVEETISTLQFANRAKAIKNKPEVNAVATDRTMIQRLTKEMSSLQAQLESKKNLEQDNYNLQKQITALQRLILNGFAQQRSIDLIQKRKQQRRVTIHTTVSTIEEEPTRLSVPKFCTPSLKYNPLSISNASEFVPIQTSNKLASVPEEPARLITPPPHHNVHLHDDVIELDSDDDSLHVDNETCSPIHKCYGSSKTPPCILRKNAKIAERNLKDIVELTEREKIFSPSAVELMEKLEQNSTMIAQLRDEIELLNKRSKEKDLENDVLKTKIKKNENELKALCDAKVDLETQCENYNTRLTDWEVSYETLKNKAKLREEELLSLLEELKVKKPEDIGKILSRTFEKDMNFMDMSKDISLVNSDNENSMVNPEDEVINNIVTDTQQQLVARNQHVVELEANLFSHQQKIASLENLTQELEQTVSTFQEKLSNMENENALLKSTIDSLNSTISNQKSNLDIAHKDIESYNSAIQELQRLSTVNIGDGVIQTLVSNEEQFVANNENIMNIIQSVKNALDVRNKKIAELKSKDTNVPADNNEALIQLETKTELINKLNSEVEHLKKQINENIVTINKLIHENNDHKTVEQQLLDRLADIESKNGELEKICVENTVYIDTLKEENSRLTLGLASKNNEFIQHVEQLTSKITDLTEKCNQKDDFILSLNVEKMESQENLVKAKAAVLKSQTILGTLSGNMQEVPELIDNFVSIFSALSDTLNSLETAAYAVTTEKEDTRNINNDLKTKLEELEMKHKSEIAILQQQLDDFIKDQNYYKQEKEGFNRTLDQLDKDLEKVRKELDEKNFTNNNLEAKLNEAIELRNLEMVSRDTKQQEFEQILRDKDNSIALITEKLNDIEIYVKEKTSELNVLKEQLIAEQKNKHDSMANIFKKTTEIIGSFDREITPKNDTGKVYEQILLTLETIASHVTFINLKNADDDSKEISNVLVKAKEEIAELTQKNVELMQKITVIDQENSELSSEIKLNENINEKLSRDLMGSQELLQEVRIELETKVTELTTMENKLRELKNQFKDFDEIMKNQMDELKLENEKLKSRGGDLKNHSELSLDTKNNDTQYTGTYKKALDLNTNIDISSPPSLLTICCNKIVDLVEPKDSESKSNTSLNIESDSLSEVSTCKCNELLLQLKIAKEENSKIMDLLYQMETVNQHLIEDQEVARNEIKLLLEPAQELQKKIVHHKTNLSILTATTYAENKSLKSQVKVLQHHHKRFHNVCQRDIPDFKKQLSSLMTLLKGDSSVCDQQNLSFKRYSLPDVLDSSAALPNFKNESTLDGDLLMLDTNITLTTAADNTLIGDNDQTCLDMTQYYSEASCQTNELNTMIDDNVHNKMEILSHDNEKLLEKLSLLKEENIKLSKIIDNYSSTKISTADAQTSPIKNGDSLDNINKYNNATNNECPKCKELAELKCSQDKLIEELKTVTGELNKNISLNVELEHKYNNLILETPSTDALIKKISIFEKELTSQKQEIAKLNHTISLKNKELKSLQEENDTISNQAMDYISETDNLNKELNDLKQKNLELVEQYNNREQFKEFDEMKVDKICSQCIIKDDLIQAMQSTATQKHTKLNRSLSDSDTSSRYNKICTLQSELHAGREDCKELTEDVVTIKNHLERSNLSMDLDESLTEGNIYMFAGVTSPQSNKCTMPDISEEHSSHIYNLDKIDCFNYYVEKTNAQKDNLSQDTKIIEIMRLLYENLITKHGNEVENLTNKLRDYEDAKCSLQSKHDNLVEKLLSVTKELDEKHDDDRTSSNTLSQIRDNINAVNETLNTSTDYNKVINIFKENLALLDSTFSMCIVTTLESLINHIVNNNESVLSQMMSKYNELQEQIKTLTTELDSVNSNLTDMKTQYSAKENEYNLLKAQKEKIDEITSAVTLDIVKREKELKDTIDRGYQRLIECHIVKSENVDSNLPLNTNINILFELLVSQSKHIETDKHTLIQDIKDSLTKEYENEIDLSKKRCDRLQDINNAVTLDLINKENTLLALQTSHEDLNKLYHSSLAVTEEHLTKISTLSKDVSELKEVIVIKDKYLAELEKQFTEMAEVKETVSRLQEEISNLKSVNDIIIKEKQSYAELLMKSDETIKKNNTDLDKMTSDILVLRESVKENSTVIENLSAEAKSLLKQNMDLKEQLESKCKECSRLETNIKTHEKTAQIQSRMIMRLEKQKNDDDKLMSETKQQLEEVTQLYKKVLADSETYKSELEELRKTKDILTARLSDLETAIEEHKSRSSSDVFSETSRRRRQSLYDSKRIIADDRHGGADHISVEAVFDSRPKPDDLFADVADVSNRSTPIRLSKGRDSLSLSRNDQSDKDDEHPSRPSSVLESRRRRQTLHDSHRGELSNTPSPYAANDSTVSQLRERLSCCQQELEDLKEKYKELDEECETCAEYLKERDEQCARLKKEKLSLQNTITELKEKLQSCNPNMSQMNTSKPKVAHASVNTDEDWANLHSVVVDRMSYDAEVEKNKKLTKTIEELRFKKQDLKNTLAKMQKALEKNSGNRELEMTKQELEDCKQELSQLKEKYRELDEECETCAQYLREKEDQCRRLKEAKSQLEIKVRALQEEGAEGAGRAGGAGGAARRRRHGALDAGRAAHAATDTGDDLLSYQVERDSSRTDEENLAKEVKHLKAMVDKLTQQKSSLEQQLASMSAPLPAMYIATGSAIVQNQQITDVMKENQKLKKMNAKLIHICKKRGKESNRENEDPENRC
ncbi:uncharacterized protein LOC142974303 [Anticarsia gemmatalis]|uniref:uncharacterized protein LOC142974303 n=1 Tax=Anticarsia gemmatalis TaxID=129554 RepID=UPI003F7737E5